MIFFFIITFGPHGTRSVKEKETIKHQQKQQLYALKIN